MLDCDTTVTAGKGPHDAKWKTGWIENTMQTSLLLTKGTKFLFTTISYKVLYAVSVYDKLGFLFCEQILHVHLTLGKYAKVPR